MLKIYYIFITLFIVFIFSGCTTHIDQLVTKVNKQQLQKYLPNQEKKIQNSIHFTKFVSMGWGSDMRERHRGRAISEINSLIDKINNALFNTDNNFTQKDKADLTKKAEYYFNRALQSDLICHYEKDLQCNTSITKQIKQKEVVCYMGKGVVPAQSCNLKKDNLYIMDINQDSAKAYKWECAHHSKIFDKEHIRPCEKMYVNYMYLFNSMRNLYSNLYDFENERKIINMYNDFLDKYQNRFPKTDNIAFIRKSAQYLFEYDFAIQLTNRDILLAKEKIEQLDKNFLQDLEELDKIKESEAYRYRVGLMRAILISRSQVMANLHYYLKPSKNKLLKHVNDTSRYGRILGYNYYSIHEQYLPLAFKHGYIELAKQLMEKAPELTSRQGAINQAVFEQELAIMEERWTDALLSAQDVDRVHNKYKVSYSSISARLRTKANIYEHLNKYDEAISYANKSISAVEVNRQASSNKLSFFNNSNTQTYKTLIRSRYGIYAQSKSLENFSALLKDVERLRARSLKETKSDSGLLDTMKLQKSLKKDELVLGYVDLDEYFLVYTITSSDFNVLKLDDIKGTKELVKLIKSDLENPGSSISSLEENLQKLSKLVVAPVVMKLRNKKKIYLLTDSTLNFIPFDLLSSNTKTYTPLINNSSILLQPYVASIKKFTKTNKQKSFLALANPKFGEYTALGMNLKDFEDNDNNQFYFSKLPETYDEVKAISYYFPKNRSKIISGNEASLNTLKNTKLSSYGYLHFATHGILGYELPGVTEPSLVLANNTFLSSNDVRELKLNARLTVLSACNTGSGKYSTGEGVMGIGQAFLSSGSQNVVMSLWQVPSQETVTLMKAFYKNINKGKSIDDSLRLAKLSLIKSAKNIKISNSRGLRKKNTKKYSSSLHPFYWASFVIIGN